MRLNWINGRRKIHKQLKLRVNRLGGLSGAHSPNSQPGTQPCSATWPRSTTQSESVEKYRGTLADVPDPLRNDVASALHASLVVTRAEPSAARQEVEEFARDLQTKNLQYYDSFLLSTSAQSPFKVPVVAPVFSASSPTVMGFEILNAAFDAALARDPRLIAFGEDVGLLGDVNQGFHDMQKKYRRPACDRYRHPRSYDSGAGHRHGAARASPNMRNTIYRLFALCVADHVRRSGQLALADCRSAKSARDHPHPRSPAGRHLALRFSHGRHPQLSCTGCMCWYRAT